MEDGRANPEPSWQQSANTRANAAAEAGHAPALFANSNFSPLTNNTFATDAAYNHGTAYNNAFGLPIALDPQAWESAGATAHSNNHNFVPSINSNTWPLTEETFNVSAAYNNGNTLPTAPGIHAGGPGLGPFFSSRHDFAPLANSTPSTSMGNTFISGAAYHDGTGYPTAPDLYTGGPVVRTVHSDRHNFAAFANPIHPSLTGIAFATGAAYNDGIAVPNAPNPYTGIPAVSIDEYIGTGFQYPDPTSPMMISFAPATSGIGNQGPFPAPGHGTPHGAAVALPTSFGAADAAVFLPDLGGAAPPRPACAICDRSFKRQADLNRHAKKHQVGSRVFRCGAAGCGHRNYRKDKLDEHRRRRGH